MPAAGAVHSLLHKKENAHDDPIYCCAWTKTSTTDDPKGPSKEFLLTGSLDCLIKVWKYENNKLELIHTLSGHCMAIVSIAVSPDGHTIASTSIDSTLIIWDLLSGNKVYEVETLDSDAWKVVFSPDGDQVAVGNHRGKVLLYDMRNGNGNTVLDTRGNFVVCVDWSPDGKYISAGSVDGLMSIFDVSQSKMTHTTEVHRQAIRSVAFSPNSKLLLTASDDGSAKLFDVISGNCLATLEHKSWAVCGVFSPDGSRVATGAADGSVRVAAVDDFTILNTFREHTATVWGLKFNAKGDRLFSVAKDKCINTYECPIPPKKAPVKNVIVK